MIFLFLLLLYFFLFIQSHFIQQMGSNYYLLPISMFDQTSRKQFRRCRRGWRWRSGVIHIGRNTNNLFIWGIFPDQFQQYIDSKMYEIWHETGGEVSLNYFKIVLDGQTFDLEHAGKNIDFF